MDKKLLGEVHRGTLETVLKQIYKKMGKNRYTPDGYKNNSGGLNFTLKGEGFRLPGASRINPARQVIQGRQGEIHMWLRKHLEDHDYDRMLVVGGIKPEGFTEISVDDMRTDFINIIRQNSSDKEVWLSVFQVMEKAYSHNNFTQGVVKLLNHYFEAVNEELYDRIDVHSFIAAVPGLSEADFVTRGVNSVFDRYNHLQMMGKGDQELPEKMYLPMDGTMQDIITTMALLKMVGEENAEFINFIMINDPNLSDFIASSSVNKVFEKMFSEITTIYHSNNLQLNLFLKMDRLILRHDKSSREYVTTLYDDPLLWMTPVFISSKNEIIWIDEPEVPVLGGHQVLFEYHPDYDRIFNSNIDSFDQMLSEMENVPIEEEMKDEDVLYETEDSTEEEEYEDVDEEEVYEEKVEDVVEEDVVEKEEPEEYREVHPDIIGKDAEEMADDFDDGDTMDINTVIQDYKTDFEFSEYVTRSDENLKDTQNQIEIFETVVTFFEVIEVIKRSNSDSLELSKFDTVHHKVIDKMVSYGLLNRENIDENTSHIMLTREGKEMFSQAMSKVKTLREDIRMNKDVYFENIDEISAQCRSPGPNSGVKTVISMGQLFSVVYLNYSVRLPPLLMATFEFWEDQSIDDPGSFLAYLDSGYLQKIHSIRQEILVMQEPKEEVKTAEVPRIVVNETVVVRNVFDEMGPVIWDKTFLSPKKKIPTKTIPQGSTDINEQIKDLPEGPKPPRRAVPVKPNKKREKKKTLTIDEVRKKISEREFISELKETEDRIREKKVLMSSETRDMGEIIKNLSILDLKLTAKIKKELASDGIHYIDQFMDLDTSTMGEF